MVEPRTPIEYPARLALANLPTPMHPLPRASAELGVALYAKRDDLTGAALSGNKVRKLEFLLAEARDLGADVAITCGGEQSNHCRATAFAAVRAGMRARLLLRTADPSSPPPVAGNLLLDRLAGADVVWISRAEYADRHAVMARHADELRAAGHTPYVIPEGGSNATGAWGYVRAMDELRDDLARLGADVPTTVIYAAGSGGTGAGLILGAHVTGLAERGVAVVGINVCDDRDYFVRVIGDICAEFVDRWPDAGGRPAVERPADIVDGYVGRGYAQSRPEELAALRDLARSEGLVLDPVYTGKAWFGMVQELRRDPRRFGERVVFLHTGGIFGLFPKADELAQVL